MPTADLVMVLDASPESLRSRRPRTSKDAYERELRPAKQGPKGLQGTRTQARLEPH